jgi:hypothetical protein
MTTHGGVGAPPVPDDQRAVPTGPHGQGRPQEDTSHRRPYWRERKAGQRTVVVLDNAAVVREFIALGVRARRLWLLREALR